MKSLNRKGNQLLKEIIRINKQPGLFIMDKQMVKELLFLNHFQVPVSCDENDCKFASAKTTAQISFAVTAKLIIAFVFATWIVQSLFFLNLKFQASSLFL